MKRRRVSAAFVELDPAELIRAKDEETSLSEPRVLASSRHRIRRSPRIAGATAEVKITSGKKSSKSGQCKTDSGQHPSFNTHQPDDSSHLTDIAPKPRDMEHAMSTTSHTTETCGDTSLAISNLVAKEDKRPPAAEYKSLSDLKSQPPRRTMVTRSISATSNPQDDPPQTNQSEVVSTTNLTSAPPLLEALAIEPESTRPSMQGRFFPSRQRRSTRRTRTLRTKADVDCNEANEDYVDRSEKSISSADSEHENPPVRKGKRRRRVSKPQTASATRRTYASSKARKSKDSGHAINQLPLTANPMGIGLQAEPLDLGTARRLIEVESNPTDVTDGTDIPDTTLPFIEKQQPGRIEIITNQQTLVNTPGCSPPALDQVVPDADSERPGEQQSLTRDAHGRGMAVGKKLADAFKVSKRVACNRHSHSSRMSGMAPSSPNSRSTTAPQKPSTRISRAQLLLGSKIGEEQVKNTSPNAYGGLTGSKTSRLVLDAEMRSEKTEALEDIADTANLRPLQTRERSKAMESTGHETGRDGAIECDEIPEDDPQLCRLSDSPADKPDKPLEDDRKEPNPLSFEGETVVSSQISVVSEDQHLKASFRPGSRNEQSPDSQQPLLAARSRTSVPPSTRRGCAVDHNGSPRLKPQAATSTGQIQSHLEMGRIRSMVGISDSSSIYSYSSYESLEEYLNEYLPEHQPEHQPVARPIWSKFQRDMFKEYGIEAEDLIKQKSRPSLFSGKAENEVNAKTLEDSQKLESRPVEFPAHMNRTNPGENSPGRPRSGSQRTIDSPGQLSDQRIDATAQCDTENVEWISALKTAQQTAHDRLLETNQVSPIY